MTTIATRKDTIDEWVESDCDNRFTILGEIVRHTDSPREEIWICRRIEWELRNDDVFRYPPESILISPGIDDADQDRSIDIFREYREHLAFAAWESLDEDFDFFSVDFSQFWSEISSVP